MAEADRHDGPWLIDELVPSFATVVEEIGVGREDAVRQPVVAHELPDVLNGIQLGALGWERHEGDVWRHDEPAREVPSGLIAEKHGMSSRRHLGCDFGQVQVHGFGVAGRQDQGSSLALARADGAEDVG